MTSEETRTIRRLARSRTESASAVKWVKIIWLARQGRRVPAMVKELHLLVGRLPRQSPKQFPCDQLFRQGITQIREVILNLRCKPEKPYNLTNTCTRYATVSANVGPRSAFAVFKLLLPLLRREERVAMLMSSSFGEGSLPFQGRRIEYGCKSSVYYPPRGAELGSNLPHYA